MTEEESKANMHLGAGCFCMLVSMAATLSAATVCSGLFSVLVDPSWGKPIFLLSGVGVGFSSYVLSVVFMDIYYSPANSK